MEAIRQTASSVVVTYLVILIFGAALFVILLAIILGFNESIVTDEAFKVTSDTSRYSCVVLKPITNYC